MACFFCRALVARVSVTYIHKEPVWKADSYRTREPEAPWKSSRVTPSSKRHRHRLAGCTTVKTRPGSLGICFSLVRMLTYQRDKPEEDMFTLPYSLESRSDLSDKRTRVCLPRVFN